MLEPGALGLLVLALATLVGSAVQAATGFGFAILAAPVFLAVLKSPAAIPLLVALHVVQSAMLVTRLLPRAPRRQLGALLAGALLGAPAGLLVLAALDLRQLKLGVGATILVVTGVMLWRRWGGQRPVVASSPREAGGGTAALAATGAVSGALTALFVMPGPPLMVQLMREPMAPDMARVLSLSFFAVCYLGVMAGHLASGAMTAAGWRLLLWLAPAVIAGTWACQRVGRALDARHLSVAVTALLVLAGVGAIISTL